MSERLGVGASESQRVGLVSNVSLLVNLTRSSLGKNGLLAYGFGESSGVHKLTSKLTSCQFRAGSCYDESRSTCKWSSLFCTP